MKVGNLNMKKYLILLTVCLSIIISSASFAQQLTPYPIFRAFDDNGDPLAGGLLYAYESGTTTPQDTYDESGVANTNPVVLNSAGEADVYLSENTYYTLKLTDSVGNLEYTRDNIKSIQDVLSQDPTWLIEHDADGKHTTEGNYYYPDYSAVDHGVTGSDNTIKYYVDTIGTTNKATVLLRHNSGGEWTDYVFSTTDDYTSNTNIKFVFEKGARLAPATGITVTLPAPENIEAQPNQQIFTGDGTIAFAGAGTVYPDWWGIDGTADDVQTNAASVSLSAGGVVKFNPKTYSINATINLYSNIQYVGSGPKTVIASDADFGDQRMMRNVSYTTTVMNDRDTEIHINNMTFDGSANTTFTPLDPGVTNPGAHAIALYSITKSSVKDCYFYDIKGDGVYLGAVASSTYCEDIDVSHNRFNTILREALAIISGERIDMTHNSAYDCELFGFMIEPNVSNGSNPVKQIHVSHNTFDTNGTNGMHLNFDNVVDKSSISQVIVDHNIVRNSTEVGVYVYDGESVELNNNVIADSGDQGIYLRDSSKIILRGGSVSGSGEEGIENRSDDTTIDNVRVYDSTDESLLCAGASDVRVTNNTFYSDSTGYLVVFQSSGTDDITFTNNTVKSITPAGNPGVSIAVAQKGIVSGNFILDCGTPMALASTVGDSVLVSNNQYTNNTANVSDARAYVTDGGTISSTGITQLNSSSSKVDVTLGEGENIGDIKTVVMREASNSSTVTVTKHDTSDPEIGTFDAIDEVWVLLWTGTEWTTLRATCTFL